MPAELVWTENALSDTEAIAAFIARDSPHYAALTVQRILRAVDRLFLFPGSGRVVPEYDDPDLREVFWRDYRIVYRVRPDCKAVVAVVHGARKLPEDLS